MTEDIKWPAGFSPSECPVHAVNDIDISSPPSAVWKLLVEAVKWPDYYSNASDVRVAGDAEALGPGVRFTWRPGPAIKLDLDTVVWEWEPESRIGWQVLNNDAQAYHAWVITPTADGCHVHTEETQKGPFWEDMQREYPGALKGAHQIWVESLQKALS